MKKFLSMMLALVMVLSLVPNAFAAETAGTSPYDLGTLSGRPLDFETVNASDKFMDVQTDAWYLDELNYALANGYISGTSATAFLPDGGLTRGQFAAILGRTNGVHSSFAQSIAAGIPVYVKETFSDVKPSSYYFEAVEWLAGAGIMNGVGDNRFEPDAPVTVEQMGVVLVNALKRASSNGIELKNFKSSEAYADASSISAWASENMALAQKYGLLVTDSAGNVNPQKVVTRAECTVSIVRFAKAVGVGVVPVFVQKSDTAEAAAKKIHDALWAEGVLNSSMTQTEKAEIYYDWLRNNCEYDGSFSKSHIHDAYGALVNRSAVCDGITFGYNMLLATEGIDCSSAYTKDHEWTTATLDGVPYHIDATVGIPFLTAEDMWKVQNARQYEYDTGDDSAVMAVYEELHLFWFADD